MRKLAVALVGLATTALFAAAFAGGAAAQTGGGCHLQGSAMIALGSS